MNAEKLTKEDCLTLLTEAYARLQAAGESRYPKRADFSEREVGEIGAFWIARFPGGLQTRVSFRK